MRSQAMIGWKFGALDKNDCKQTFYSETGPTVVDMTELRNI